MEIPIRNDDSKENHMARSTVIVAIAVLIVSSTSAQNLLTNPGFDVADQLIGWSCSSTDGLATWISDDRLGAPTSGAMQHFVNAPLLNGQVACIQCLPVDEFYAYEASAWHYWPDDPDVTQEGTARMSIIFYSAVDCTGSLGVATVKVGYHVALDTWYQFATDEITAPAGATSARFTVTTWQDVADHWVRTRIDDLDFSTTTLFRDGFESGWVDAWSDSVP